MTDLRASESDLALILGRLGRSAPFADLMAESTRGQSLRLDRRSTNPSSQPYFRGAVVRGVGGDPMDRGGDHGPDTEWSWVRGRVGGTPRPRKSEPCFAARTFLDRLWPSA